MARKSRYANKEEIKEEEIIIEDDTEFKVGIYLRLSSKDLDDAVSVSIENQKAVVLDYISEHPEFDMRQIYIDDGYSGMNFNRPGFKQLYYDIMNKRVNCIVVKDLSRLGRDFLGMSDFVFNTCAEHHVRVLSIVDPFDSFNYRPNDHYVIPFLMLMNQHTAKDFSGRVKSSIHSKMEDGTFIPSSNSIPYGYLRDSKIKALVIDDETAPVVKRMYEMRNSGMNYSQIAKTLNDEGIASPGKLRYDRNMSKDPRYKNAYWQKATVKKILNDPAYIGTRIYGTIDNENSIVKNAHPPIISEELYESVMYINHAELEKRSTYNKRNDIKKDNRPLYYGKLFCGDCGRQMLSGKGCSRLESESDSFVYYECSDYRYSQHMKCKSHYVREDDITRCVTNALNINLKLAVDIEQFVKESYPAKDRLISLRRQYVEMDKRQKALDEDRDKCMEDFLSKKITREQFKANKTKIEDEIYSLRVKKKTCLVDMENEDRNIKITRKWLDALKKYFDDIFKGVI